MKRRAMTMLCTLVFLLSAACALFAAQSMDRYWGGAATCSLSSMTAEGLSSFESVYPEAGWTAYAQSDPETLACDALPSRTATAPVLRFLGAPERIAFFPLISGRLPRNGERGVCALDEATAFRLLGSTNPDGDLVSLNGLMMYVIGVIDMDPPLVLMPAMQRDRVDRLVADDRDTLQMMASALVAKLDPFELSGAEVAKLARWLSALPLALAAAMGIAVLRRLGGVWRPTASALLFVLALGMLLALLWCVPVRFLPARWSDLSFYGEQISDWRARTYRVPDVRDQRIGSDVLRVSALSMVACIALLIGRGVRDA